MIVGSAEVEINARLDNLDSRLEKALGDAAKKAGEAADRELGEKLKKTGATMTKFVTLPVLAGFALATKAASDLGEQQDKTTVVFGKSAKVVEEFADTSAEAFGLSKRAAFEAAGTYGNLFRAIGLAEAQSAKMSVQLVQTAADLASFNNADINEVFDALRAGLTGEAEPLKKFGINVNEARIKTEALNLGLLKQGDAMTSAAKAQAVYSLVQKDTILAQGNFAQTSAGLANQTRIVKAQFEDTAATLGQKLIPFALTAASAFSSMLDILDKLPGPAADLLLIGGGVLAATGPVLSLLGKLTLLRAGMDSASLGAKLLGGAIKGIGVASGIAVGLIAFVSAMNAIKKNGEPSAQAIAEMEVALLKLATGASNTAPKVKNLGKILDDTLNNPGALGDVKVKVLTKELDELDKGLASLVGKGQPKAAADALKIFADQNGTTAAKLLENKAFLGSYTDKLAEYKTEQQSTNLVSAAAAKATEDNKDQTQKTAEAYDELEKSIDATKKTLDRYLGVQLTLDESYDAFKQASDDLTASIKENGKSFDGNTEKGRANRESVRELVTAAGDLQRAEEAQSGVLLTEAQRRDRTIALLRDQARNASPEARAEIQRYIDRIAAVPNDKVTQLKVDAAEADRKLEELKRKFRELGQVLVGVGGNVSVIGARGGRIPLMAGGQYEPDQGYVVNEIKNGGEIFFPETRGRVISNADARSALANQVGGQSIQLTFAPVISGGYSDRGALIADLRNVINTDLVAVVKAINTGARSPAGVAAA